MWHVTVSHVTFGPASAWRRRVFGHPTHSTQFLECNLKNGINERITSIRSVIHGKRETDLLGFLF